MTVPGAFQDRGDARRVEQLKLKTAAWRPTLDDRMATNWLFVVLLAVLAAAGFVRLGLSHSSDAEVVISLAPSVLRSRESERPKPTTWTAASSGASSEAAPRELPLRRVAQDAQLGALNWTSPDKGAIVFCAQPRRARRAVAPPRARTRRERRLRTPRALARALTLRPPPAHGLRRLAHDQDGRDDRAHGLPAAGSALSPPAPAPRSLPPPRPRLSTPLPALRCGRPLPHPPRPGRPSSAASPSST